MTQSVTRRFARLATAVLVCLFVHLPVQVFATPSALAEKQAEAAAAEADLEELQAQLELRAEEHAAISAELERTRGDVASAKAQLEKAEQRLVDARGRLEGRAAAMYKSGAVELIEVLLDTRSFGDFLSRMDWLRRVGRSDAMLVAEVKAARTLARAAEESLVRRESEQLVLRERAAVKQHEVEQAIASQRSYVENLRAEVAEIVRQEEERQQRVAEAAARAAAQAARNAASTNTGGDPISDGDAPGDSPTPAGLGRGHPEVVEIALQYVGVVDYVYGGTSPESGFDCSGLVQYCYARVGVTLPRASRDQFRCGTRIPADRLDLLQAGDLVFFGYEGDLNRVHHVGIYVGDGQYVHAPQTGQRVSVSSLAARIESRADFVGASRL